MKRVLLILLIFSGFQSLFSQDYTWWNEMHDWDGVSSWRDYIIYSSDFMGPNALPVPTINNGVFSNDFNFELGTFYHSSAGDNTGNLFSKLDLALAPGIAGVSLSYVPYEVYSTDTLTRDIRRARDYDPEGHSFGDVYITTYIQVLKNHISLPDILISVNLKTASGTNLGNARNTDSPGYYFDLSMGKEYDLKAFKAESIRPYFMGGFYSYQTNREDNLQNDAILYGAGFDVQFSKFNLNTGVGGYYGYFGNGDQPAVFRMEIHSAKWAGINYSLKFQQGINDYSYTSVGISAVFTFDRPRWMVSSDSD